MTLNILAYHLPWCDNQVKKIKRGRRSDMAMNEEHFIKLFRQLPDQEKNSTIDFMEFLSKRQLHNFYDNLEEVDAPLSEEELRQMQDTEFVPLEDLSKELGWGDESSSQ